MSKSGRQQMAYRNYVRKQIHGRQRQIARSQKAALRNAKHITPSEPKVSMNALPTVEPVPESVSEPVAEPVTVSASTATEKDNTQGEP
jgi:hypothetical protein